MCANRVLLAPIGNPAPRGFSPLDTPLFLTAEGYPNHQNRFGSHAVKNKNPKKLLVAAWRNFGFSSMGVCCEFANSHGEATAKTRGMVDEFEDFLSGCCSCFNKPSAVLLRNVILITKHEEFCDCADKRRGASCLTSECVYFSRNLATNIFRMLAESC